MEFRLILLSCVLLLIEISADEKSSFLQPSGDGYCPFPLEILEQPNATTPPSDLSATCIRRRQEDDDKVKQAIKLIKDHLTKQADATDPIRDAMNTFTRGLVPLLNSSRIKEGFTELEELRMNVLVAAIEGGRVPDALTQFLILGAWNRWPEILKRIYENPRLKRKHTENVLEFIRDIPGRDDRLAFYHELKKYMVEKKQYESYLGAMFARDASYVVFEEDGKTARNESDVKALYTTMKDGAVAYFRRALLTGAERYDLILLDRDHPKLFDLVFDAMMAVPKEEMRKFDWWKTMEAPCRIERPQSKVRMYVRLAELLLKHFQWKNENEYYAPMLAGYFELCRQGKAEKPVFDNHLPKMKELFSKFDSKMNYDKIAGMIGKENIEAYAG